MHKCTLYNDVLSIFLGSMGDMKISIRKRGGIRKKLLNIEGGSKKIARKRWVLTFFAHLKNDRQLNAVVSITEKYE